MLSLPSELIKREDEKTLKRFMIVIRKLRKDLSLSRKEFASILDVKDDVYIKFETTGKASAPTLFKLFIGLSFLNVNINKLLSLENINEYNIYDFMNVEERLRAVKLAAGIKLLFRRHKQRRKENIGPPYVFKNLPALDVFFEMREYKRNYGYNNVYKTKKLFSTEEDDDVEVVSVENESVSVSIPLGSKSETSTGEQIGEYLDLKIDK